MSTQENWQAANGGNRALGKHAGFQEAGAPALAAQHTPGALRLAEILIPEGIDRRGRPSRLKTAYGEKTRDGIADMIDRETAAPDLLAALEAAHRSLVTCNSCHGIGTLPTASERAEIESATLLARAAIAKAAASA